MCILNLTMSLFQISFHCFLWLSCESIQVLFVPLQKFNVIQTKTRRVLGGNKLNLDLLVILVKFLNGCIILNKKYYAGTVKFRAIYGQLPRSKNLFYVKEQKKQRKSIDNSIKESMVTSRGLSISWIIKCIINPRTTTYIK